MYPKLLKIAAVLGGIILLYLLVVLLFGKLATPAKTVTLTFWNMFDTTTQMKPLLDDFTSSTGIKVNYKNFVDVNEYRDTLLASLAAGEGPDVFVMHNTWIMKYRSLLAPAPMTLLTPDSVQTNFVGTVSDDLVLPKLVTQKGKLVPSATEREILGLPMYVDSLALYYNYDIFKNILTKPVPRPGATWEEVKADAAKLVVTDENDPEGFRLAGFAAGRADNLARGVDLFYLLYKQLKGTGFINANGKVQLGSESARDSAGKTYRPGEVALDYLTRFSRNIHFPEHSWNADFAKTAPEKELDAFARGKVAMVVGYSYAYKTLDNLIRQNTRKNVPNVIKLSDVRVAPIPNLEDPALGGRKVTLADYFALSVAKTSPRIEPGWQLINFLTSKASEQKYHIATQKPTSRIDLIEMQSKETPLGTFSAQAVYASSLSITDPEKYAAATAEMLDSVADGRATVAQALTAFGKNLTCLLNVGGENCL